jgi:hypothetical protein
MGKATATVGKVIAMDMVADSLVIRKAVDITATRKVTVRAVSNLVAHKVTDTKLAEHSQAAVGLKLRRLVASILAAGYILQVIGSRVKVESALARRAARNLVEHKAIRNQVRHQQQQFRLHGGRR